MRILRRLPFVLLAGAVIIGMGAGCARAGNGGSTAGSGTGSGDPTATETATQPAKTAVVVSVTRAGGFAGVNQTIAIAADGAWVYTDARRAQSSERGTLTEAQRLELVRLASAPGLFAELAVTPGPISCADVFSFVINVDGRSGGFAECGDHPHPKVDALLGFLSGATPF